MPLIARIGNLARAYAVPRPAKQVADRGFGQIIGADYGPGLSSFGRLGDDGDLKRLVCIEITLRKGADICRCD